jgi:hypothetical protein
MMEVSGSVPLINGSGFGTLLFYGSGFKKNSSAIFPRKRRRHVVVNLLARLRVPDSDFGPCTLGGIFAEE